MKKTIGHWLGCAIVAVAFALGSHVYLQEVLAPCIAALGGGPSAPPRYPWSILCAAIATSFIPVLALMWVYYHVGAQWLLKPRWLKAVALAFLLLALKGELRQLIMDAIAMTVLSPAEHSLLLAALQHLDKWVANILLALVIVYACPQKTGNRD